MKFNLNEWTVEDLQDALDKSGYFVDNLVSVTFAGMNKHNQGMFDITFEDEYTDEIDKGRVFVYFDCDGVLTADF